MNNKMFSIETIKVSPDDTILIHFNTEYCTPEDVNHICEQIEKTYPHNPIVPILPKYGIEKFEIENSYKIESNGEC